MTDKPEVSAVEAMAVNRRFWEEAVAVHVRSDFYDVDGFRAGRCTLTDIERRELGDVSGLSLLHLQCHFGLDTLSLARRGAVVTGVDFSSAAVEQARRLSDETGLKGRFVQANIYDLPGPLAETFDLVYTAWGVLGWLADIERWGEIVAAMLRPGGRFYIAELHPSVHWFDDTSTPDAPLQVAYDYLGTGQPELYDEPGSYADPSADMDNTAEYFFRYSLSGVVTALASAGLKIDFLHEHDTICWPALPALERGDDRMWRMPDGRPRIPLSFSLSAGKPA